MLNYIIVFFILAVMAAVFGFTGLAGDFAAIARFLAMIFVVLFLATLVYNIMTGKRMPPPS